MNDLRKELGKRGEEKAAAFLEKNGYTIVERNFKCKTGEIDIIAMENGTIVAVEVKTRSGLSHGLPCEAINAGKKKHIIRTFNYYALINKLKDMDMRIDVVEILATSGGDYVNLIKNAF